MLFSYNGLEGFIPQWKRTCGDRLVEEVFGESEEVWYLWVDICSMTIWWVLGVLKVSCSLSWAFSTTPLTRRAITTSTLASEETWYLSTLIRPFGITLAKLSLVLPWESNLGRKSQTWQIWYVCVICVYECVCLYKFPWEYNLGRKSQM